MAKSEPCSQEIYPDDLGFPDEAVRLCRDAQFRAIFKMVERRMANRDMAYQQAWNEFAEKVKPSRDAMRQRIEELPDA
jgi:hypothetical protein